MEDSPPRAASAPDVGPPAVSRRRPLLAGGAAPSAAAAGVPGRDPGLEYARLGRHEASPVRCRQLLVGGRHHEFQLGRRLPVGQRRSRDGHRRVQRHRSGTLAGPVREVRVGGQDPLLHQRRQWPRRWRLRGWRLRGWRLGGNSSTSGSTDVASQISTWVESHFTAQTVDGTTLYNLTQPTTSS